MKGQIPQSFIEELLSRIDIKDIIGERVPLRRAGANYLARCPFHSEKTPSFTVSSTKQFYHCFGCGASGDAIKFLTEFEGLHFVEALESLADRAGLSLPQETQNSTLARYSSIYDLLNEAATFYQQQLRKHPNAPKVHDYLKGRGLTGELSKQFGLGFAPPSWDSLVKALGTNETRLSDLCLAGLIIKKGHDHYYDRFRNRVMFPIRDRRGRVVGFGGRVLDPKDEPKYLNSPETVVFNKGKELYGLYEARLKNRSLRQLLVVEGYMDVVGLAQGGIDNAVATLGTALSDKQVETLFQQASDLVFCFDGDEAGLKAARRALPLILPQMKEGRRAHFMLLPSGEDPDSFIRSVAKKGFLAAMDRAHSLSDFLFEQLSRDLDLHQLDARAELVTRAKPLINRIPKGVLQHMFYHRLGELAQIQVDYLQEKKVNLMPRTLSNGRARSKVNLPPSAAERAVALLLRERGLVELINTTSALENLSDPAVQLLCAMIEILRVEPSCSVELIRGCLPPHLVSQFSYKHLVSISESIPEAGIEGEFLGAIKSLEAQAEEQRMEQVLEFSRTRELSSEEKDSLKAWLEKKRQTSVE